MKKIAIFVDVQNIYYTVKQNFNCHFDYLKFWQQIASRGQIVQAYAYAIDRQDKKQMQFQQALTDIGFEIKLKPYIQRRDGSAKGDWDVGITIDILDVAPSVDIVILASGDGDFDLLLNKIKLAHNVCAEVYGVPGLTAESLIRASTFYHPIDKQLLITLK
tara:strand:- start:16712 stop:17194 length:483 start_codon:yes stop_codon:yes gene_type:complete